MGYIRRNLSEIRNDRALLLFGGALAFVNVLVAYFWLRTEPLQLILGPQTTPICWPLLDGCERWRVLSADTIGVLIRAFGLLSVLNGLLLISGRHSTIALAGLAILSAFKCVVILQDYRLIHNQHYMANWITACYFLVPDKRLHLKWLCVMFYVWAGVLKLNVEWISGQGLYGRHPLGMPSEWVPAACVYVIFLELVGVWGVLARHTRIFWGSFVQLLLFHISSFWVVGYFYPVLMFLILSIFVLDRFIDGVDTGLVGFIRRRRAVVFAVCVLFAALQLAPRAYAGDPAITGEGRYLALHMFDAPVQCKSEIVFRSSHEWRSLPIRPPFVYPRISCDPLIHFRMSQARCREMREAGVQDDFEWILRSRKVGQLNFEIVAHIRNFCSAAVSYSVVGNSWIQPGHASAETANRMDGHLRNRSQEAATR